MLGMVVTDEAGRHCPGGHDPQAHSQVSSRWPWRHLATAILAPATRRSKDTAGPTPTIGRPAGIRPADSGRRACGRDRATASRYRRPGPQHCDSRPGYRNWLRSTPRVGNRRGAHGRSPRDDHEESSGRHGKCFLGGPRSHRYIGEDVQLRHGSHHRHPRPSGVAQMTAVNGDFSIGVEEEYQIVDPATRQLRLSRPASCRKPPGGRRRGDERAVPVADRDRHAGLPHAGRRARRARSGCGAR